MTDELAEQERRIDDLRAFEREYRARLRQWMAGGLKQLFDSEDPRDRDDLLRRVRRAVNDPGSVVGARERGYGIEKDEYESLGNWQARAVLKVLEPELALKAVTGG
jgi:hypothetical protein